MTRAPADGCPLNYRTYDAAVELQTPHDATGSLRSYAPFSLDASGN
ncbi:MAG: hypothetical protein GX575_24930 [Candidatus Anammoximicrobium sp.]|nr:hypothetical protein [Candidatus Anammoximicrobium sp.]